MSRGASPISPPRWRRRGELSDRSDPRRRLGFAVKVLGGGGLASHDTRRWQSDPDLGVSIEALHRILGYMRDEGLRMYRISSDFVPYATHPDMPRFHGQIGAYASELEAVGAVASEADIRLSLHPSQYVLLNAQDDEIARNSMRDLESQAELLDAMRQGPEAVVVVHVGGVYGDKDSALQRFVTRYRRLGEPARRRLVVENDEMSFTLEDCLHIHERIGVPVIFDHQHHRLNPGTLGVEAAARAALASWPGRVVPKIHFSSTRLDARTVKRGKAVKLLPPLLRQHADYVDPWTFAELVGALADVPFDVMLEAKAKDLALKKLLGDLDRIGRAGVLSTPAAPPEEGSGTGFDPGAGRGTG